MKVSTNGIIGNRYVVFAGLTLALLMSASCSKENVQAAPAMPPPLVTVTKATAHDVPKYLDEIGRNAAFESVTVTPQVGGRITERHFQDGENLKRGQLLVRHRPASLQGPTRRRAGNAGASKAALELAKIQFARDQESWNPRHLEAGLRHKKEHGRGGPGAGAGGEAALENAKLNLDYCYIHSPIDGRAGARLVDVGNVVQANSDGAAVDPAARSHLRGLHGHGERSAECSGRWPTARLEGIRSNSLRIRRRQRGSARVEFLDNAVQNGPAR